MFAATGDLAEKMESNNLNRDDHVQDVWIIINMLMSILGTFKNKFKRCTIWKLNGIHKVH